MALIDSRIVRREARKGLVKALKWTADRLRDDDTEVVDEVAEASAEAAPAAPVGAAAYVAEHQAPPDDAAMLGALSGDMGPALASRVRTAAAPSGGGEMYDRIVETLHTIFDPEIPVDIYDLGLIYEVDIRDDASVGIKMTLTSPNCPAAQSLPGEVETKVAATEGVAGAEVDVVFEPPWTPDLMSEEAKLELNIV